MLPRVRTLHAVRAMALLAVLVLGSAFLPSAHAQPTVVATVKVGVEPYGVAYDASKAEVFVVNDASYSVSVISDSTNQVIANVSVGSSPSETSLMIPPGVKCLCLIRRWASSQ